MATRQTPEVTRTVPEQRRRPSRRSVLALLPVAALGVMGGGIGVHRLLYPPAAPATPLGAVATVAGGMALIHGIIPLESVPWEPPTPAPRLAEPIPDGGHRVRLLLDLTAVEPGGIDFASADYSVQEIVGFKAGPLWTSHERHRIALGETLPVTMVFEIPNKSVRLELHGPGSVRLSLGTDHHTS
jgi:hypothetical protein